MGLNARHQLSRVVITGLGLVTPLGIGVEQNWTRLMTGETAVRALVEEDLSESHRKFMNSFPSKVVACVPKKELENCDWRPQNDSRRMLPFIDFADTAAAEALLDSRLMDLGEIDKSQIGVSVGVGMSGSGEIASTWDLMISNSPRKISPFFVSKILPNMASGNISVRYGFQGPNLSSSTACAAGAQAIGDAFNLIRMNQAQIMIAGGSESCIDAIAFLGFGKMKALSTNFNHSPSKASRPFDSSRDGFVIGEGAGVMVLENLDHAMLRKAPIYAEIVGYGLSGDGHHITHPHPEGQGAFQSMSYAIRNAGLTPRDISYINAHATSTPVGDVIELEAIQRLFGESNRNHEFFVSSTKGSIGHLLGAAGAVEAVYTVLSVSKSVAPGTVNLENPDFDSEALIRGQKQSLNTSTTALSNSFGFGGTNASLLFKNLNPNDNSVLNTS